MPTGQGLLDLVKSKEEDKLETLLVTRKTAKGSDSLGRGSRFGRDSLHVLWLNQVYLSDMEPL